MNTLRFAGSFGVALFAVSLASAQDVAAVAPGSNVIKLDNPAIRVVEAAIPPGAREPMHTHPAGWYYVVQGGTLEVEFADGRKETWAPKAGESGWLAGEGPHVSRNVGDTTLVWTLIEVKEAGRRQARLAAHGPRK